MITPGLRKISAEEFMKLFNKATAVDYAGQYMTIQDDDDDFIFLPNYDEGEIVKFEKDIIALGVWVNSFGDLFRFDTNECEWFGMLSSIRA
jgi:hypothetical protein